MRAPTGGKPKSAPWLAGLLLAALGGLAASSAAEARGFVGFGFGVPLGPPAYYPPPPVYYAPPVYAGPTIGLGFSFWGGGGGHHGGHHWR